MTKQNSNQISLFPVFPRLLWTLRSISITELLITFKKDRVALFMKSVVRKVTSFISSPEECK